MTEELTYEELVYRGHNLAKRALSAAYAPAVVVPTAREVMRGVHAVASRCDYRGNLPRDPRSLLHDCRSLGLPCQPDANVYTLSKQEELEERRDT